MGLRKKKEVVQPAKAEVKTPDWVHDIKDMLSKPKQPWIETLSISDLIAMYNYADKKMKASISNKAVWSKWVARKEYLQVLIGSTFATLDLVMQPDEGPLPEEGEE
jgi:hypothetical protein